MTVSPADDGSHITREHLMRLTLTRDQFITLISAVGAAQAIAAKDDRMTWETFTQAVNNPMINAIMADLTEPLTRAIAGYGIDQFEQDPPGDPDSPR